jgi:MATE family multidrug resistance protein
MVSRPVTATLELAAPVPRARRRLELAGLLKLAVPLSIASGGQALMGLTDAAVVGRLDSTSLAGVGLGNGLFFAFTILGIGVVMGADPLVSQEVGAQNTAAARTWLWRGVGMAVLAGLGLCPLLGALPWALHFTRVPWEVIAKARVFLLWRLPGLIPLLIFHAQRGYLQAVGRVRALVVVTVLANVLNLLFDLLLVFGGGQLPAWTGPLRMVPSMGVAGAAMATDLCAVVEVAYLGLCVGRVEVPRFSRKFKLGQLGPIFSVGLPVGLHFFLEGGLFTLAGVLAARLGSVPGAAHQIALSFAGVSFTIASGIGMAGSVRVGHAVGARDTARARLSGLTAFGAGASFMCLSALIFMLFPKELAALMTNDPAVIALAVPLLVPTAVFQVSDGTQGIGAGVLRGAGDSRFTFVANLLGHYGVGLPLALVFGVVREGGVVGIWWGLCAGLTIVGVMLFIRFYRLSQRPIAPLTSSS